MTVTTLLNEVGRQVGCLSDESVHGVVLWYETAEDGSWKWHVNSANMDLPETIALLQLGIQVYTDMFKNNKAIPYTIQ